MGEVGEGGCVGLGVPILGFGFLAASLGLGPCALELELELEPELELELDWELGRADFTLELEREDWEPDLDC